MFAFRFFVGFVRFLPRIGPAAIACLFALLAGGAGAPRLLAQGAALPRVHILATGGTISNTGRSDRLTAVELVAAIPELGRLARITTEQFSNVASGSITVDQWREMATRINALFSGDDPPVGVIVTHGTDTMEETAFFLDLTVGGCAPVIVTGAMRNVGMVAPDGPANLYNSVRTAVAPQARGRGTMVLMNDVIYSARGVTKSNTTRTNAFTAPDEGPLGVADPDSVVFTHAAPADGCAPPRFDVAQLGAIPRVDIVESYIGADSVPIDALVAAGAKGIVLASVGRGGSTPGQSRALRNAVAKGVAVVTSSRTGSGRVGGRSVDSTWKAGEGMRMSAYDLNPQKARVLLMLALASSNDLRDVARMMAQP
jgi:L-asparaginase type II